MPNAPTNPANAPAVFPQQQHQSRDDRLREEARCWSWRFDLLDHEILELGGVMSNAVRGGGVPSAAMTRASELLFEARKWLHHGEHNYAEDLLRAAELEIVKQKREAKERA